ncbi:MAG TPA: aminotransferase class I/II-fold pyridoxal phosphate-dependent enzyme [Opitutaceae bacterium]|nr:aminotransferase class I/II-fold pyridoxal phosphate-dependent enzyme [Opitutaceae bacterium]
MVFKRSSKVRKPIADRCADDSITKFRLKYAPYYRAFEAQRGTHVRLDGRDMVMLSSNDYLGLSFDPRVIAAGQRALDEWGTSPTGARSSNGSRAYHETLEEALADFLGVEACHVSSAGYLSCLSGVAAFAAKGDCILADKNIHSCLWDGIRLSMADVERFSHNNPEDLRAVLHSLPKESAKLLVFEGVYSMEGHIARLPEFVEVADEFGCFVVVDDAHGFGVLGRGGRGTADHFNATESVDLIVGSLSKSLASTGGFVAGSRASIEFLRTHSKQTIFSAAISPAPAAIALEALRIMREEPEHHERLWKNTRHYMSLLKSLKLDTWESETPAVPIVLGSKENAYRFWNHLLEKGVFTVMSIAPAVPAGKDLVRTAISAMHTEEDFERIAEAMAYAVKRM